MGTYARRTHPRRGLDRYGRADRPRAAGLVPARGANAALAGAAGKFAGPLQGLAQRDHAPADHGEGGDAALYRLPAPLAGCDRAGACRTWRRARRLGGARLLRPCPQSPCLRTRRGRDPWRAFSRLRGCFAPTSRHWGLYVGRNRRDRLRAACGPGGRQYRTGDRAAVRHRDAAAGSQAGDQGAGGAVDASQASRRFRARLDGPWCIDLHPAPSGLRPLSAPFVLSRICSRAHRATPLQGSEGRATDTAGHGFRRDSGGRRGAAAGAAAEGATRWHAGGTLDPVGGDGA